MTKPYMDLEGQTRRCFNAGSHTGVVPFLLLLTHPVLTIPCSPFAMFPQVRVFRKGQTFTAGACVHPLKRYWLTVTLTITALRIGCLQFRSCADAWHF